MCTFKSFTSFRYVLWVIHIVNVSTRHINNTFHRNPKKMTIFTATVRMILQNLLNLRGEHSSEFHLAPP
jgi:hypothetical protein